MLKRAVLIAGIAGLFTACGAPLPGEVDGEAGESDQAIIGGTTDNGDPSVVAIFAHAPGATSGSLCTGTVISPTAVLTAAHCVAPSTVGTGQVFEVITGTTLSLSNALKVASTTYDKAFNPNKLTAGHDIGIVKLASPTTLKPIPFNKTALSSSIVGKSVRLVGYGSNTHSNTGAGTKRTVTTTVSALNSLLIKIGSSSKQTCHGDSGGPALMTINGVETVVGVTSYGTDSSTQVCINGGYDTRVDDYVSFINANL